jgi:acetolactate synthase-1/3 small subunit
MQTFAIDVNNTPGVLNRIASVLRRCSLNIDSLSVGRTDGETSRVTLLVDTDARGARYVEAGVGKLNAVRQVRNLTNERVVARTLVLVKVAFSEASLPDLLQRLRDNDARVAGRTHDYVIVEMTGDDAVIDAFLMAVRAFGILDVTRSGCVAMALEESSSE